MLPEAEPDEGAADDEPVFAGADEDVDADAEADADVDVDVDGVGVGVGEVDFVGVGDVLADVVGVADVRVVAGDECVLAGCDVPEYGDELADDDGEAVGVVGVGDADETSGATDAGVVAGDV